MLRSAAESEKLAEVREAGPSVSFQLRGETAVAVLLEAGQDIPRSAFVSLQDSVAVYGRQHDEDGLWLLGVVSVERLDKRTKGRGTRLRLYPESPWTTLSAAQVDRLRTLVGEGAPVMAPPRRPSALSSLS